MYSDTPWLGRMILADKPTTASVLSLLENFANGVNHRALETGS